MICKKHVNGLSLITENTTLPFPFLVLLMREHLQVIGIAAYTIMAFMVDLFFPRYKTKEITEHDDMYCDGLTIKTHSSISTTPASAGSWSLPFPTASIVIYNDTGHNLVKDVLPATRESVDDLLNRHQISSLTTR